MKSLKYIFMAAAVSLSLASCMNGDDGLFNDDWKPIESTDAPYGNNTITEDNVITLAQLKAIPAYAAAIKDGKYAQIEDDIKLKVRVVGNDIAGNIYKQIFVQDETGAIIIGINKSGLSGYMAEGQEMLIALKDLYIGGYGGAPQLGTPYNGGIGRMAESIWMTHFKLIGKPDATQIKPIGITKETDLKDDMIGKLVVFKNVTFKNADGIQTLISGSPANGNYYHKELDNFTKDVVVRTSSYADFGATVLPFKDGQKLPVNLIGVLSKYKDTWQLMIRKGADITFDPVDSDDPSGSDVDPSGDGTKENPFNVAGAIVKCQENGKETPTENSPKYYVKGIVAEDADVNVDYNNITFKMVDVEGGDVFTVFRIEPWPGMAGVKKGDEVVIYGPIFNYKGNTPETGTGTKIVEYNGTSYDPSGGGTPSGGATGDGTLNNPYNVAAAINAVKDFTWTSKDVYDKTGQVYVKGKISRIASKGTYTEGGDYGNATFFISDDGNQANEFQCYRVLYLNNTKYNEYTGDKVDIKVGDVVIICGELMNYKGNTPETVSGNAYLYKLN